MAGRPIAGLGSSVRPIDVQVRPAEHGASAMRWFAAAAAVIAATVDILYSGMVSHAGARDPLGWRVTLVAAFIAALAMTAALSARASAAGWRPALLGVSAIGLLAMGFIAIFSIGLPLLVAGGLALVPLNASLTTSRQPAWILKAGAGALLALTIFVGDSRPPSEQSPVQRPARKPEADRAY